MTTETKPHETRCRELAERTRVQLVGADKGLPILDERFAALRGEHEWTNVADYGPAVLMCRRGQASKEFRESYLSAAPYCLRTDAGALLEAAAACGFAMEIWLEDDQWIAVVYRLRGWEIGPRDHGATSEEALSAALVAAVES